MRGPGLEIFDRGMERSGRRGRGQDTRRGGGQGSGNPGGGTLASPAGASRGGILRHLRTVLIVQGSKSAYRNVSVRVAGKTGYFRMSVPRVSMAPCSRAYSALGFPFSCRSSEVQKGIQCEHGGRVHDRVRLRKDSEPIRGRLILRTTIDLDDPGYPWGFNS
jgi:hypothetical protein